MFLSFQIKQWEIEETLLFSLISYLYQRHTSYPVLQDTTQNAFLNFITFKFRKAWVAEAQKMVIKT